MKTYCGKFKVETYYFDFTNVNDGGIIVFDGLVNCLDDNGDTVTRIEMELSNNVITGIIKYEDNPDETINQPISDISQYLEVKFGTYISGIGVIQLRYITNSSFINFIKNSMDYTATDNYIFLFRSKSSRETVDKDLEVVKTLPVKYTRPITHKRLQIDMIRSISEDKFNFVYLTVLNRFYYVTDMLLTNEYALLTLTEDVLMTFSDLIHSQTAFVERNQYNIDSDKVDELVTYDYDKAISTTQLTDLISLFDVPTDISTLIGGYYVVIGIGE